MQKYSLTTNTMDKRWQQQVSCICHCIISELQQHPELLCLHLYMMRESCMDWICCSSAELAHCAATLCGAPADCTCTSSNSIRDTFSSTYGTMQRTSQECGTADAFKHDMNKKTHLDLKILIRFCCFYLAPLVDSKPHRTPKHVCSCIAKYKVFSRRGQVNCGHIRTV